MHLFKVKQNLRGMPGLPFVYLAALISCYDNQLFKIFMRPDGDIKIFNFWKNYAKKNQKI
jgi:hypothetical protein